jgi:hypothetical protein
VQAVDGRQFFVELHERDVRRPLVRLVEDVGRVDHGGAAQRALLREVLEEPSSREDIQVRRELVDDAQLERSQQLEHDAHLLALAVGALLCGNEPVSPTPSTRCN